MRTGVTLQIPARAFPALSNKAQVPADTEMLYTPSAVTSALRLGTQQCIGLSPTVHSGKGMRIKVWALGQKRKTLQK